MTSLLPRLLDLSKPGSYAFARYAPQANSFDVYTFTVGKQETIQVGDKKLSATRVEIREAEDSPTDSVYLDDKGAILKLVGAGGIEMSPSDRDSVMKEYPRARAVIPQK